MTDEEIGKALREMRRAEGLGLTKLARQIGVTKQHLLNMEFARSNYSMKVLRKYLNRFGYNITIEKLSPGPDKEKK